MTANLRQRTPSTSPDHRPVDYLDESAPLLHVAHHSKPDELPPETLLTLAEELVQLSKLCTPLVLSQLVQMLMMTTDCIFLGHLDQDSLAASGIGVLPLEIS